MRPLTQSCRWHLGWAWKISDALPEGLALCARLASAHASTLALVWPMPQATAEVRDVKRLEELIMYHISFTENDNRH